MTNEIVPSKISTYARSRTLLDWLGEREPLKEVVCRAARGRERFTASGNVYGGGARCGECCLESGMRVFVRVGSGNVDFVGRWFLESGGKKTADETLNSFDWLWVTGFFFTMPKWFFNGRAVERLSGI